MSGNPQQVDMNQPATISMSLFQWNGVLMCLRTGNGQAFTWESVNPLVQAITQQLQAQMYQPPPMMQRMRPNGEDEQPREGESRDRDARVEKGRTSERL